MAAPKVVLRKLKDLKPDPSNARTHSQAQIDQLVASITRFGWTNPALADDLIRAGHGRATAAQAIYDQGGTIHLAPGKANGGPAIPTGTMPVIDCTGWSDEERKAYSLADNQLALQAGWNLDILTGHLAELQMTEFNIAEIGFDQAALDELGIFKPGGVVDGADPDVVPDPPDKPASKLGDVWVLGDHRLVCGDSTDAEVVALLLGDAKPHLMVTDPPYGVEYSPEWREKAGVNTKGAALGKVLNDDNADWSEAWALFPGDVAYVWHAGLFAGVVADSLAASDLMLRSQIIWAKSQLVMSRGDFHWQHEPCWYAVRKGRNGHFCGGRKQTTVWNIDKPNKSETGHSTQKPVECMSRPMENNSKPGDSVYEPFSGSGTTIIAAEMIRRFCYAIELNPVYVDVAIIRWEKLTGRDAVLEATGQTFAEVSADRIPPDPADAAK